MTDDLLHEATDPQTSAARLEELGRVTNEAVSERVGQNPNTPLRALNLIWRDHPRTFLQNPAVALFQLEDPSFLSRIEAGALASLLTLPELDEALVHHAAQGGHRLTALAAAHPNASTATLEGLSFVADERTRLGVAKHPNTPTRLLVRLLGDSSASVRLQALAHPKLPASFMEQREPLAKILKKYLPPSPKHPRELLCLLAQCGLWLRQWLAEQPNAPAALLVAITTHGEDPLCIKAALEEGLDPALLAPIRPLPRQTVNQTDEHVAKHPNAPEKLLRLLWRRARYGVKVALAKNPNLPEELFEQLERDTELSVLLALAVHPKLPLACLQRMLQIKNRDLLCVLVQHPLTKAEQLRHLLHPEHWKLRLALATEKKTPADILEGLLEDEHQEVRDAAMANPRSSPKSLQRLQKLTAGAPLTEDEREWLRTRSAYVRRLLIAHPQTPKPFIEALAASTMVEERLVVAKATHHPELLARLSRDPVKEVALQVAQNASTPAAVLHELIERKDDAFLLALSKNPATPSELLELLYQSQRKHLWRELAQNPSLPGRLIKKLSETGLGGDFELLAMLARNPHAPGEIYAKLPRLPFMYIQRNLALRALHQSGADPSGQPPRVLSALIRAEDCDPALIRWALRFVHAEVLLAIVQAPNTPAEVLEEMLANNAVYQHHLSATGLSWLKRHPNSPKLRETY